MPKTNTNVETNGNTELASVVADNDEFVGDAYVWERTYIISTY